MVEPFQGLVCQINTTTPIFIEAEFDCRNGEITALLGVSGAGKTTLLKILAGLIKPQQGEIHLNQRTWFNSQCHLHLTPQQRHIGYVPQHFGLFEHQTALENVISGLNHLPKAERHARANDWLEMVGLATEQHKRPPQLSGGQRQRIALARALAREPDLLLLDEPFSAVDPQTRKQLHLQLLKLKSRIHCPVIMVTHNMREAQLLADHLVLMNNGRILQQGTTDEVISQPNSITAAHLLGNQNVVYAKVISQDQSKQTTQIQLGSHQFCLPDPQVRHIGERVGCLLPNELNVLSNSAPIAITLDIHCHYQDGQYRQIMATIVGDHTPLTLHSMPELLRKTESSQAVWLLTPTDITLL
ncbi:ATP-binding cassette domain-containing protein [Parashewanella curva]|uniref:ATP-binding cassette domain-containing protein n=1 Tax=Parashewanella curva TaxID=2338552 RepID=A0A3L8Q1X5_9GAMM|nr:ATP-binding cassette domain-containing protein [Parashewanella curva]RLV60743.1 ATP-binding cassette domain-containing protein [Parashewanella curva]